MISVDRLLRGSQTYPPPARFTAPRSHSHSTGISLSRARPKISRDLRAGGQQVTPTVSKMRRLQALRQSLALTGKTLALVWRTSRGMSLVLGAVTVVASALPLGVAYAGKRIMDAVVARSREDALRWVLIELAVIALSALGQR